MATTARPVAACLGLAWLGTFLPPAWPALAPAHWPAEWAHHLAAGWPGTAPVARAALGWLIAGALLRALPGAAHAWRTLALVAAGVLALRFTWLAGYAGNGELCGAAVALALWPAAERLPGAWLERLLAAAAAVAVLWAHLAPHAAAAAAHGFHWLPFTDLARGDGAGIRFTLLCEKLFWLGTPVWLLVAGGAGAVVAAAGVAVAALLAELLRLGPGGAVQYATATDPAIALVVGLAIALVARGSAR